MTNYYFLATALPPLRFGVQPDINFQQFEDLLNDNLSQKDYEKTEVLRLFFDIENIKAFWQKKPFDPRGSLSDFELEEALLTQDSLPQYVFDFLNQFENQEERLANFAGLLGAYFRVESEKANGFLRKYLIFEREWRLVLAGYRAKQLNKDVVKELQFEDPNDDFVAQIIAQKDSKAIIAPNGYQDFVRILEEHFESPIELYQAINEYRFREVEKLVAIDMFSVDRVLGYMVRLIILEQWLELDQQKGLKTIEAILKNG